MTEDELVFSLHACLCITCMQSLWMPGEGVRVPGFGVMPGFEMLCECQELNLGSFEEQSVPISIKVPLHLNIKAIFFLKNKNKKSI